MSSWQGRYAGSRSSNWQDWCSFILGVWLFISPWVLQFGSAPAASPAGAPGAPPPGGLAAGNAAWNAWVLGVIIALVAIAAIREVLPWEEWVNFVLGIWLFIAPWVLSFSGLAKASWDHWIVGILVFLLSLSSLSMARTMRVSTSADMAAHAGDRPSSPPREPPA